MTHAAVAGKVKFVSTDSIILGFLLGGSLIAWALTAEGHIIHSAIGETLFTALYLTMVVGWSKFKLPTFFAKTNPRLAAFTMAFLCGFISLFFDSFAVILLLSSMTLLPFVGRTIGINGYEYSHPFRAHAFKVICAFNALTFGGAFYIGELWGLPYYIKCGMANAMTGWPLLLTVLPVSLIASAIAAWVFPVKVEPVEMDKAQGVAALKIIPFLVLIIVTHDPVLCLGVLLAVSSLFKEITQLFKETIHELSSGAQHALGLIMIAFVFQQIPGVTEWFEKVMVGVWIMVWGAISSPLTGAMAPVATTLEEFYLNTSYIMMGAPVLVSSSLVAIVVFKDTLHYDHLPPNMQKVYHLFDWVKHLFVKRKTQDTDSENPVLAEMVSYTLICIPLIALLGVFVAINHHTGAYVWAADLLGIEMAEVVNHAVEASHH